MKQKIKAQAIVTPAKSPQEEPEPPKTLDQETVTEVMSKIVSKLVDQNRELHEINMELQARVVSLSDAYFKTVTLCARLAGAPQGMLGISDEEVAQVKETARELTHLNES